MYLPLVSQCFSLCICTTHLSHLCHWIADRMMGHQSSSHGYSVSTCAIRAQGSGTPLDKQYRYVVPQRVTMVFGTFWSENGYTLCPFWSGIGYGFQGILGGYINVWTYLSFQFQMSRKEREMCKFEMGLKNFCLRSYLSNDHIISAYMPELGLVDHRVRIWRTRWLTTPTKNSQEYPPPLPHSLWINVKEDSVGDCVSLYFNLLQNAQKWFNSLYLQVDYPEIAESITPRHRFMSAYEQRIEPPDKSWQYLLFAAEPYETIAFKVCSLKIVYKAFAVLLVFSVTPFKIL